MQIKSLPFSFRLFLLLAGSWALSMALGACGGGSSLITCPNPPCTVEPPAEFLYATTATGQVLSLPIDSTTGAVGTATSVAGPVTSLAIAAVGSQFVYASDFQHDLIYGYSINATPANGQTGALTPVAGSPFAQPPLTVTNGLAAGPGGNFLYATAGVGVDAFSLSNLGVPALIAGSPFLSGGSLELAVDPSGKFLFVPDIDGPNGVSAFTIDSTTGVLTLVPGSPFLFAGQTVLNSRPFGIVVDSTGQFVFVALEATNQVAAFSIVSGTGALMPVPGSPFPAGNTPFLFATTGKFLYVSNALDGTVSGYSIDSASGVLTPLAGFPFSLPAASLVADPSGKFLYGASGAGIFAFTINADGSLTPLSGSPFPAAGARLLTAVQLPTSGG
jgi:DNA-binding beta-propeller fold protein YncE